MVSVLWGSSILFVRYMTMWSVWCDPHHFRFNGRDDKLQIRVQFLRRGQVPKWRTCQTTLDVILTLWIQCSYHNLYVNSTNSMFIPLSICPYHDFYVNTMISCPYHVLYVYTMISMSIALSLCWYHNHDLYVHTMIMFSAIFQRLVLPEKDSTLLTGSRLKTTSCPSTASPCPGSEPRSSWRRTPPWMTDYCIL